MHKVDLQRAAEQGRRGKMGTFPAGRVANMRLDEALEWAAGALGKIEVRLWFVTFVCVRAFGGVFFVLPVLPVLRVQPTVSWHGCKNPFFVYNEVVTENSKLLWHAFVRGGFHCGYGGALPSIRSVRSVQIMYSGAYALRVLVQDNAP